jgi:hypothetical protein
MGKSWENHGKIGNSYVFEGFEEFVPRQIGEMWSFFGGKQREIDGRCVMKIGI